MVAYMQWAVFATCKQPIDHELKHVSWGRGGDSGEGVGGSTPVCAIS